MDVITKGGCQGVPKQWLDRFKPGLALVYAKPVHPALNHAKPVRFSSA